MQRRRRRNGNAPMNSACDRQVLFAGEVPQLRVPGGTWQGARLAEGASRGWALLSCTMAPAWDEREFELGQRESLAKDYPSVLPQIHALTR